MGDCRSQRAVEHPKHHRDTGAGVRFHPSRAQALAQDDARLDVDHVIVGQDCHGRRVVDPGRLQRRGQGRVTEDHRDVQLGCGREISIVVVAFDDRDVVARGFEIGGDPDSERAESDDDDVVLQFADFAAAGGLRDASGQEQISDERHQDRGGSDPREHQYDAEQP